MEEIQSEKPPKDESGLIRISLRREPVTKPIKPHTKSEAKLIANKEKHRWNRFFWFLWKIWL